jgi:hypothetical protein
VRQEEFILRRQNPSAHDVGEVLPAATRFLSPLSPNFPCSRGIIPVSSSPASGNWTSANLAVAIPFWLPTQETVFQLGWMNGSGTMTDAVDIGIYSGAGATKLISSGATTRSGVSSLQFVDVADTAIGPGWLWLAMSSNGTTANNNQQWTFDTNLAALMGVLDKASSHPLPAAPFAPTAAGTLTMLPYALIALRSLV